METLLMVAPDGESGQVPTKEVPKALEQGYERAIRVKLNGQIHVVSFKLADAYLKAGATIVQEDNWINK